MNHLSALLKLYLRIAFLRRQALVAQGLSRGVTAAIAVLLILLGVALLNVALFLWLRTLTGDLAGVAIIGAAHLLVGGACLVAALRRADSPEAAALEASENEAFNVMRGELDAALRPILTIEANVERITGNLSRAVSTLAAASALLSDRPDKKV